MTLYHEDTRPEAGSFGTVLADAPRGRTSHRSTTERAADIMQANIDAPYSTSELARLIGLSRFHFIRTFQNVSGISPIKFLYAKRMQLALRLLITTDDSILDICLQTGYASYGTFTTRFGELVGAPPSHIRRMSRDIKAGGLNMQALRRHVDRLEHGGDSRGVRGRVLGAESSGLAIVGLFDSAWPKGRPISCALADARGDFSLAVPPSVNPLYLFAMIIPWTETVESFVLQAPASVGKSGPMPPVAQLDADDLSIVTRPTLPFDPPVLFPVALHLIAELAEPPAAAAATRPARVPGSQSFEPRAS